MCSVTAKYIQVKFFFFCELCRSTTISQLKWKPLCAVKVKESMQYTDHIPPQALEVE